MKPANEVPLRADPDADVVVPIMSFGMESKEVGRMKLAREIFKAPIRSDLISRVVRWQLAKRRAGTASAKTRAEVRGGGKKPWKQKGLGRARAGSIRAPNFKGLSYHQACHNTSKVAVLYSLLNHAVFIIHYNIKSKQLH
jgi:hypothetical protein